MSPQSLDEVKTSTDASLRTAIEVLDRAAMSVALLVDDADRLVGLMTDGDVRRALLLGASLEDRALPFATTTPQTVNAGSSRALVLDLMRALRIAAVPEVGDDGELIGLHTLSDVVGARPLPNLAVVMAGGRGTRLGPVTQHTPKALMQVAGRSILEWIVLNLVGGGIREVHVSVNHLADQIEDHLGDGSHLGCRVHYLREDEDNPLGTAGSLAMLRAARPDLADPVLVMNGDLMVQFDPGQLLRFHAEKGADVTMAMHPYQHEVPYGVVELDEGREIVTSIVEKPTFSVDVNAGVYAVSPAALETLRPGNAATMPELVQSSLDRGARVAAWPLPSDWIDVGTPTDLARAKGQV